MSIASNDSFSSSVFGSPTQTNVSKVDPLNMSTKRILVLLGQIKTLTGEALNIKKRPNRPLRRPYLCEISYALLEYAITEMFLWMFIEGLYLNNLVTSNVLKEHMAYNVYFIVGWSLPLIITIVWAAVTGMHYKNEVVKHCWYGYNFLPIYWIVQGPRLAVVLVNLIFLLNILRVLVIKIRRTDNTELNKVRKALRAAFVLLPLLGITNALDMTEAPLDGSVWQFALWSYSTHFLRSFQGFFIALLYCFLNAEVRMVMRKHYENYKAMRETRKRQAVLFRTNNGRQSHSMSSPIRRVKTRSESTQTKGQQQKPMRWPRGSGRPRSLADLEISLPTNDESRRSTGTDTGPDLDPSRRSSSASCIGQCIVTVEHEYDNNRALALRDCRYRRSEPSDSFSCQQDAETST
ncbi:hypothetical protein ABMA28_000572 [Loxostege sticticalis]|uniref:G-protein coupled receptors family 2 profile 2 domain-containing protein n=1 Tax=Loxostege sticticalis TaxID=481309 RepID=A0ABD0TSQ6_LOXSC